jgi:hypothetical protein
MTPLVSSIFSTDNYPQILNLRIAKTTLRGRRGSNRVVVGLQLSMQSVPKTTNVVSSNPADIKVYSIQHHVIKFVSDLPHNSNP